MSESSAFTAAAIEWLKLKWGDDPTCPMCGSAEWVVGEKTRFDLEGGRFTTPRAFPTQCGNCGLILWLNGEDIAIPEEPQREVKGP